MISKVLIPTQYFYPATKAGGPVESLYELVNCLENNFDITVLTTNQDIDGSYLNLNNIRYGNTEVIYRNSLNILFILKILNRKKFDFVYLNSFFSIKECFVFLILSFFFKYKTINILFA